MPFLKPSARRAAAGRAALLFFLLSGLACATLTGAPATTPGPSPAPSGSSPGAAEAGPASTAASSPTPIASPTGEPGQQADTLGQAIPIAGAQHIEEGAEASNWNSDPPTSGDHYPRWAPAGFYEEVIPDGYLVHNMEHGYVIIYYNCSRLSSLDCDDFRMRIQDAMVAAGTDPNTQTPKMIAVPRPQMPNPITYASWGRLYQAENFVAEELVLFVNLYRSQAPEGNLP